MWLCNLPGGGSSDSQERVAEGGMEGGRQEEREGEGTKVSFFEQHLGLSSR